jgi:hypothetical protein
VKRLANADPTADYKAEVKRLKADIEYWAEEAGKTKAAHDAKLL